MTMRTLRYHVELHPAKAHSTAQQLLPVICSFSQMSLLTGRQVFHLAVDLRPVIENHDIGLHKRLGSRL